MVRYFSEKESTVLDSGRLNKGNGNGNSNGNGGNGGNDGNGEGDVGFQYRSADVSGNGGMHPDGIMQSTDDVTLGLATRFMEINKMEAHKNFGNSADNMTAVVCTIYPSKTST